MTKYMEINGVEFQVVKSKYTAMCISNLLADKNLKTLDECYQHCSEAKKAIYEEWMDWSVKSFDVRPFGIRSYNVFCFTLSGLLHDSETDEVIGLIEITSTRNTVYML